LKSSARVRRLACRICFAESENADALHQADEQISKQLPELLTIDIVGLRSILVSL
jgi:hypothetical protein